jgi:NAD(P)-dependent dehydrogenase (short-subunit alcohol dehydrogenase family)
MLFVTGGSRGIGAAIVRHAAAAGTPVAFTYVRDDGAATALAADVAAAGGRAFALQCDVGIERQITDAFARAHDRFGPLSGLVNNAGITGPLARVDAVEAAMLARLFDVNVLGTMLCAGEAVRRMSTRYGGAGGAIVNLSSVASRLGGAGEWVHYAASKGAVDTFTLGLAREVAAEGIRVNAVSPGLIETDIHAAAGDPERPQRLAAGIPMQRPGTADEVARTVLWLLSSDASYVTGAILEVSGGR